MSQVICMVAPNGARRSKEDHPNIPLDTQEIALTAKASLEAGASVIHLHVRNLDGTHSIDIEQYCNAIKKIKEYCGDRLLIQITTEAVGIYNVQQQMDVVYKLKPEACSLAVRELARATNKDLLKFDQWMKENQVLPQWIIYNEGDLEQYRTWVSEGVLCGKAYPVLFVLGNYTKKINAEVSMLATFLASSEAVSSWMVCAFGPNESRVMQDAIKKNGHIRIGFENNLWQQNGELVKDNAELVRDNVLNIKKTGLSVATSVEARQMLTPCYELEGSCYE